MSNIENFYPRRGRRFRGIGIGGGYDDTDFPYNPYRNYLLYPADYRLLYPPRPVSQWIPNTQYLPGQYIGYNGHIYVCIRNHISDPNWTPEAISSIPCWKLVS
jgi:hypothetical protein